ncbi:hypothetical protein [Halogeometricum luteum]|uniref:DUF8144 domain-containing protein n=1 Tax=Halogeometricum luteum TaxID=2950537 RepID=A0ABU2FXM9_9EURY|nr:hypothetical protein [Halogeometricum sp. S3BR5-2]MDS0293297.1 hypothetical protein [Halogeometricum sp. S3BR5-2]
MVEKGVVDLVEEWQSGAFIVFGCVAVAVVLGVSLARVFGSTALGVVGFFGGGVLSFFLFSYLSYGRTSARRER